MNVTDAIICHSNYSKMKIARRVGIKIPPTVVQFRRLTRYNIELSNLKEGNVFNDALNTLYLRLYGVGHNYGKGPFR